MTLKTASEIKAKWWSGKPYVRPRLGPKKRPLLALPPSLSHAAADERARVVIAIVAKLKLAGRMNVAEELARKAASATTSTELRGVEIAVDAICRRGVVDRPKLSGAMTFKEFGESWTKGALHTEFPQYVKKKRTTKQDAYMLGKHVYPVMGPVPLAAITLEHAQDVMRRLSPELSSATQRHVAQCVSRLLKLAVYPAQLLARSPLPPGFLPRVDQARAFTYLYPAEDTQLLARTTVPLVTRLLYGFLTREGMRVSEAKRLVWGDVDLDRGIVHLDENKTDDPRAWALGPGVLAALKTWRNGFHPSPKSDAAIFCDGEGSALRGTCRADELRAHLKEAKLERPQLHERSKTRRPLRVHDLRATFVTVSLACGKTETWVADRTGHRSSSQIHGYRRQSRLHEELGLGALAPLVDAIPELRERAEELRRAELAATKAAAKRASANARTARQPPANYTHPGSKWAVTSARVAGALTASARIVSGERGIRTLGTLAGTHDFQSCTFGHSVISPDP